MTKLKIKYTDEAGDTKQLYSVAEDFENAILLFAASYPYSRIQEAEVEDASGETHRRIDSE